MDNMDNVLENSENQFEEDECIVLVLLSIFNFVLHVWQNKIRRNQALGANPQESREERRVRRTAFVLHLTRESDVICISQLRMDRQAFQMLCEMCRDVGGLKPTKNTDIDEMLAMFLYTLGHHYKNRNIGIHFYRSGDTVSRTFQKVLHAIIKLHRHLFITPVPIDDDCTDPRWSCFKGCLGALDGTFVPVTPKNADKARYRTRKGILATNVLGVCDPNMRFVYCLPGWEGSAHDGRVLRDAICRPNPLRVPEGCYYLVDGGYCNADGFLAPFRGERYHLNEYEGYTPQNAKEYFNMKHTRARNVIERCFGLLKGRFKILSSASFFPIETQIRIIICTFLIHNHIRLHMSFDPQETIVEPITDENEGSEDVDMISAIESSTAWTNFRMTLANNMFNQWQAGREHN